MEDGGQDMVRVESYKLKGESIEKNSKVFCLRPSVLCHKYLAMTYHLYPISFFL